MTNGRIDGLLHEIPDFALRAEIREFAGRPTDEQNVFLYLELRSLRAEIKALKGGPSKTGITALVAAALVAAWEVISNKGG